MEGIENLEAAQSESVQNNVPDEAQGAEPVAATDDVPDSGLPTEGDSDDATVGDGEETRREEDDDPLSNVGDPVE